MRRQISSIYQYFPTKAAILRTLVERNQQRVSASLIARQIDPDCEGDASQAEVAALMIAEITGPVARLALQLGSRRSEAVVAQLKVMIISYLDRMAAEPCKRC